MAALAQPKAKGLSPRSIHAHARAVESFGRWLQKDGRTTDNPLLTIGKMGEDADRRLVRRPLSDSELRQLIDSTRTAPTWRGMTGPERAVFYTIGAMTGLRRSELASLTPEAFRLDDAVPVVAVEASYTKNGKLAEQPIPRPFAESLRSWLSPKAPGRLVFNPLPEKTGLMLKSDLQRCGTAPVDGSGRVVDMHSYRHGYISALANAGVPLNADFRRG
jgi:integrase